MKKINFTKEQEDFFIENYPKKGSKYCEEKLNVSKSTIYNKAKQFGLKISQETKNELQRIRATKINYPDIKQFKELKNPTIIYLLGLFWADGYLHSTKNRFELYTLKSDYNYISSAINELGEWNIKELKKVNRNPSVVVGCYNKNICNLMREYGFVNKSIKQPLFLNKIPKELIHYFFRGLIDGDGCFYISPNKKCRQFYLAGSFEQEWDYFINFLKKYNIKFKIKKKIQKKTQKYSVVFLSGKQLIKMGDIIYKDFSNDKLGFLRKYEKYLLIKETFNK